MIIKAKQAQYFKFMLLFYSRILNKSRYLNSYFFSLKFLMTLTPYNVSFYFLSKSFTQLHHNYVSYYKVILSKFKYLTINTRSINRINFLYLLFTKVVRRKYYISRIL